ncbi:hypothetical protein TRVA0_016S00144 [Trichomonascus vanleenenianus]|uniref:uncharacterized protein n=1 Tax=Trichomonascus vanleenenianus TaxID=2268995 RepID=UPI003EC98A01
MLKHSRTDNSNSDRPRLRRTGSRLLSRLRRRSKHENEHPNQSAEKPIKVDQPGAPTPDQPSKNQSLKSSKSTETVVSGHSVHSESLSDQSTPSSTSCPIKEEPSSIPIVCSIQEEQATKEGPISSIASIQEGPPTKEGPIASIEEPPITEGGPISSIQENPLTKEGPILANQEQPSIKKGAISLHQVKSFSKEEEISSEVPIAPKEHHNSNMPRERTVSSTASTIVERARSFTSPLKDIESLDYSPLTQDYLDKARLMKQQPRPLENLPVYHSYDYRFSTSSLSQLVTRGIRPNGTLHGTSMRRDSPTSLLWRINSSTKLDEKSRSSSHIQKLVPWASAKHITSAEVTSASQAPEWPKPKRILTLTSATESDFESDASSEDGMLTMVSQEQAHLTSRSDDPWYTERTFVGEEEDEEEEEVHMGELMVKARLMGALDWILGYSSESDESVSKQDKKKKRDQAESSLDVAWCLGLVSGLI